MEREPDIELFTIRHNRKTTVYRRESIEAQRAALAVELPVEATQEQKAQQEKLRADLEHLLSKGEWKRVWLKEALSIHEERITQLCQVRSEETGFVFDPSRQAAARRVVMIERWEGFGGKPTMEMELPLSLAKVLDEEILTWMYASELDADFFGPSSGS